MTDWLTIVYRTVFFLFRDDCYIKVVLRTFITLLCLAFVFLLKMSSCVKHKCVKLYISDANKWAIRLGVVGIKTGRTDVILTIWSQRIDSTRRCLNNME